MNKAFFFRIVLVGLLVASLILGWFLPIQLSLAQRPPNKVLALRPGGYVSVECPDVFDALNDEGITVEFWFYLTGIPSEWQDRWMLLSKPGSYSFYIRGRRTGPAWGGINDPEGTVFFSSYLLGYLSSDAHLQEPLERWRHVAFQFKVTAANLGTGYSSAKFFDGMTASESRGGRDDIYGPGDMLFIGGSPEHESLEGWIDGVRISNKWRYTPGEAFKPQREFRRDRHTLALWDFDEGPWAHSYKDESGNGYTLLAGGTLPVNQTRKTAALWGQLKRD